MNEGVIREAVNSVKGHYYRFIILAGGTALKRRELLMAAVSEDCCFLDLNIPLAERLLNTSRRERGAIAFDEVSRIISELPSQTILIDRIELLFNPELKTDPLRTLKEQSRNKTIVVSWPGKTEPVGSNQHPGLIYAEPGHSEYQCYRNYQSDCYLVPMG